MPRSTFLLAGLAGLLLVGGADAPTVFARGGEGRTDCGLYAVLRRQDKGSLAIYDGVRRGLELARLPRVCLEAVDPWPAGLAAFVRTLTPEGADGRRSGPVFGIGDEACDALAALETAVPRVFAVQRFTVGGAPLRPLPSAPGSAVVYADVGAERLGAVLAGLLGARPVRAAFTWAGADTPAGARDLGGLRAAAGIADPRAEPTRAPQALLHLRLGIDRPLLPYAEAVARATRLGIPLVSDDRGRFGQGAVVTLVPVHDLVGRAAAEAARRLRADPQVELAPRAVTAVEIWIDLHAADAQGLELPLPFVARADRLRRSRVAR